MALPTSLHSEGVGIIIILSPVWSASGLKIQIKSYKKIRKNQKMILIKILKQIFDRFERSDLNNFLMFIHDSLHGNYMFLLLTRMTTNDHECSMNN